MRSKDAHKQLARTSLKLVTEDNGIKCLKWDIPKTFFWLVTKDWAKDCVTSQRKSA